VPALPPSEQTPPERLVREPAKTRSARQGHCGCRRARDGSGTILPLRGAAPPFCPADAAAPTDDGESGRRRAVLATFEGQAVFRMDPMATPRGQVRLFRLRRGSRIVVAEPLP